MRQSKRVPVLTRNAMSVLEKRYLLRDDQGQVRETPGELFERVANAVAQPEGRQRDRWANKFYEMMASRHFMPNSPTLMNAGKSRGQLSACYVLPIEDSLGSIFETLRDAALIHQSGGGTGFSFSALRPSGSVVRSSQGVASGPVSFMRIFDAATETIKQGGTRRGANMGILRVDHPDIVEFIDSKRDQASALNFNISVGVTTEFMEAVSKGGSYPLRDPRSGKSVGEVKAREVFDRLCSAAWECGDPGLVFLDRIDFFNPTPQVGRMESTNPCGEQPLLPYESCNLGSLNLGLYVVGEGFNWEQFRQDIWDAVRFLDNVIDINEYPVESCARITRRNRKIGLGVMGFADLLVELGVPYDSPDALAWGERVMGFLDREAKQASASLAEERGAFPNWKGSLWDRLGYRKLRNATVSTVAPTGTISILAGASSGIEPIFSGVFYRNVLDGQRLVEVHPSVAKVLTERGKDPSSVGEDELESLLGKAWRPAPKIRVSDHLKMQAVFQRFSDSAVSKTVNLAQSASVQDVAEAYQLAFELGCKGITVYRDQSRNRQVLERPAPKQNTGAGDQEPSSCPSC